MCSKHSAKIMSSKIKTSDFFFKSLKQRKRFFLKNKLKDAIFSHVHVSKSGDNTSHPIKYQTFNRMN